MFKRGRASSLTSKPRNSRLKNRTPMLTNVAGSLGQSRMRSLWCLGQRNGIGLSPNASGCMVGGARGPLLAACLKIRFLSTEVQSRSQVAESKALRPEPKFWRACSKESETAPRRLTGPQANAPSPTEIPESLPLTTKTIILVGSSYQTLLQICPQKSWLLVVNASQCRGESRNRPRYSQDGAGRGHLGHVLSGDLRFRNRRFVTAFCNTLYYPKRAKTCPLSGGNLGLQKLQMQLQAGYM